ncbi:hypothetical protein, partial [Bacillus sp. CX-1]|uniref:hypothetical protein n=1 Tax=Bacillus sp. CX-1 TaxID=2045018 RepID=UPI001C3F4B6C
ASSLLLTVAEATVLKPWNEVVSRPLSTFTVAPSSLLARREKVFLLVFLCPAASFVLASQVKRVLGIV